MPPPYVSAPEDRLARWAAWLDRSPPGRRIGLVCHGDQRHPRDRDRSIALAAFAPILTLPDIAFVLVQTEIRSTDRAAFEAADNVRCPAAALTDYADTAALLSGLDLLISVDTSAAHLAGAMGLPVWTLLPYFPDYRWGLGSDDSAWYPSMRLFRQERAGAWQPVIERVRAALGIC
jgi:ADP-heptose:LPS heptosyltransferase